MERIRHVFKSAIILFLAASFVQAEEYIRLRSSDVIPYPRYAGDPFEEHRTNPNDSAAFGPTEEVEYLPTVYQEEPTVDPVLQKKSKTQTRGVDLLFYDGTHQAVSNVWFIEWIVEEQDLNVSQDTKYSQLVADYQARLDQGYTSGPYLIEFNRDWLNTFSSTLRWMEESILEGIITESTTLTFTDLNNQSVSLNRSQVRTQFINFGVEWYFNAEKFNNKEKAIYDATTPAEVDAVTWDFNNSPQARLVQTFGNGLSLDASITTAPVTPVAAKDPHHHHGHSHSGNQGNHNHTTP